MVLHQKRQSENVSLDYHYPCGIIHCLFCSATGTVHVATDYMSMGVYFNILIELNKLTELYCATMQHCSSFIVMNVSIRYVITTLKIQ